MTRGPRRKPHPPGATTTAFLSSGAVGDVLYAIPIIKTFPLPILYLNADSPIATLPTALAEALLPLLNSGHVLTHLYQGGPIDIRLDEFRRLGLEYKTGHIPYYYSYLLNRWPDVSKPWLTVKPDPKYANAVLVNWTGRYQNHLIRWRVLSRVKDPVFFIGYPEERDSFVGECGKRLELAECRDYWEMARIIAGCKVFAGVQSSPYAVAEGLGSKRILAVSSRNADVIPMTPQGVPAWNEANLEAALRLFGVVFQ